MSNDKANAAYHPEEPPSQGFRDQGYGQPVPAPSAPLTTEEVLARAAHQRRYDRQRAGQQATAGDWYGAGVLLLVGGGAGFLLGAVLF